MQNTHEECFAVNERFFGKQTPKSAHAFASSPVRVVFITQMLCQTMQQAGIGTNALVSKNTLTCMNSKGFDFLQTCAVPLYFSCLWSDSQDRHEMIFFVHMRNVMIVRPSFIVVS